MSRFKFIDKFAERFGIDTEKLSWKTKRRAAAMERDIEEGEKQFAKAFGMDFESAVVNVLQRRMPALLPFMLPDILFQLAQGDAAVNTSDKPFVACLHKVGAFWGEAPAGEVPDRSTAAFHAFLSYDTERGRYTINMLEGTAQVVGYVRQYIAADTFVSFDDGNLQNWWCWLEWTQNTDTWELQSSQSDPGGEFGGTLNVPLWKFTWAANGAGQLVQFVEGAVLLPWTINALDVDSAS